MRLHLCLLSVLGMLVVGLHATDLTAFPSCAITCDENLFSTCSLSTNTTCFCASDSRVTAYLDAVESNCTVKEFFTTKRLYQKECDITPLQRPPVVNPSTLIPFILATVFFAARIFAKSSGLAGGWGLDDYTIIIAYVLGTAIYFIGMQMIRFGFGANIWDITPQNDITLIYKLFQGLAVMYKIQISLAKISVILFLLRIFQAPNFRYLSYALIAINTAIGITWACVDSFRCLPTHLTWDGWTGEESGKCINFIDSILVNCLVNIFVDSVLIMMPVYEVSKLQMPLRKKLTVALMFIVGSVLTIIAIIRVVVFWNNRWGYNQTKGLYPLIYWSVIECQISVMCACLPASRALLGRWFPEIMGGSSRRTYASGPEYFNTDGYARQDSKINKSVSYTVNYGDRSEHGDSNSDVELVVTNGKVTRR
ncbi:hypothetical protein N7448_008476 [Penicillium atrosanguineum]|uniref:Extracellular membrane protein CFEM domain-containing protein n=1 Tax=Penicillium atrosanguineum TaxID=1132637 RepID=A0A9W9KZ39_9EURO|nr:hypothetical protein N7448_008476 [Penicillium atrosanguineum]KAJ5147905.1 hypothetical protein N7526_001257 [Penicillium atrosanguineum]KAJ5330799.1 hypothetical protein N7476_000582 [Penicillium atrosanguineum]